MGVLVDAMGPEKPQRNNAVVMSTEFSQTIAMCSSRNVLISIVPQGGTCVVLTLGQRNTYHEDAEGKGGAHVQSLVVLCGRRERGYFYQAMRKSSLFVWVRIDIWIFCFSPFWSKKKFLVKRNTFQLTLALQAL